jgi:predicted nuclease of restriction endonuclease-like (RecB) superfamily
LVSAYGNSFSAANLYRMMKLAEIYEDFSVIEDWACFLSWSHFCEIMRVKNTKARAFYAKDAVKRRLGIRALRKQISRKAYERKEIANTELAEGHLPFDVFRDPYLLDVLGLKENFLEADLEKAILVELEAFILEFGHGFSFVERQKRMTMDGDDFTLDLLFFHRCLRRLVAIELKIGKFKPVYKGQMEFYLHWLNKFERKEGENAPIGLILCTEASRDQIELMEMDKAGIAVAEYWTVLPPKAEFERKIRDIYYKAQERLERRKMLPNGGDNKNINYFIESDKDDGDEDR